MSSAAFSDIELSVDVANIQLHMSITLKNGAGVAAIGTAAARGLDQEVRGDPLPDNPAHALVIGRKPKSVKRALRDVARFTTRAEILSAH